MDTPTVGRIVRYVLPDTSSFPRGHRPAIITGVVGNNVCNLTVFYDQKHDVEDLVLDDHGMVGRAWSCPYNEGKSMAPGTWHWPERV